MADKEPTEWYPIATAPKDVAILVYGFGYTVAHFNTLYNKWVAYGAETEDTRMLNSASKPTHWTPLPSPPPTPSVGG